ncbi:Ribonuclease T2 family protein [Rhodovulum sp. P5]|uniref:ribonuclease T2 family protein n=1 Tax=Rhodovulum sp. P5 TaxID=1564506 RepID=UPI0009C2E7B6|nr:ribonuclease T2 [Rhodovulum sp. P5]ARE39466.1 Ribonuclease T2 family protein [Rhodovulum sp. P5]
MRWLAILILSTGLAHAEGEPAGAFDYYVLSLSWSPTWCALNDPGNQTAQCAENAGYGWILHGLWPQYEQGWPSYCPSVEQNPLPSQTKGMADIMGSAGLAWHQWKKHGKCTGLSASDYYALARRAYESVNRPEIFRKLTDPVKLPAAVVEEAFLQANPDWRPDMLTITCKSGRIQEARLCLTRELEPRLCGEDVVRDCQRRDALMAPLN